MRDVIAFVANDNYAGHVRSLMTGCICQGNWQGDFCVITARDCGYESDMEQRGIDIYQSSDNQWSNFTKFHIFADYFSQWDHVLYLDCDCLIQGDLNQLVKELSTKPPALYFDGTHDVPIIKDWEHFDDLHGLGAKTHPQRYEDLRHKFPHIDSITLSSDVVFFSPETVPPNTVEQLQAVGEEFLDINPARMDQQVMNLLLYGIMEPLTKDYCTWWAFDDPGNRVQSDTRGWQGNETPTVIHYWGMYAPWLSKTHDAGAYYNHRLDRPCKEVYDENLSLFNTTFPIRD